MGLFFILFYSRKRRTEVDPSTKGGRGLLHWGSILVLNTNKFTTPDTFLSFFLSFNYNVDKKTNYSLLTSTFQWGHRKTTEDLETRKGDNNSWKNFWFAKKS